MHRVLDHLAGRARRSRPAPGRDQRARAAAARRPAQRRRARRGDGPAALHPHGRPGPPRAAAARAPARQSGRPALVHDRAHGRRRARRGPGPRGLRRRSTSASWPTSRRRPPRASITCSMRSSARRRTADDRRHLPDAVRGRVVAVLRPPRPPARRLRLRAPRRRRARRRPGPRGPAPLRRRPRRARPLPRDAHDGLGAGRRPLRAARARRRLRRLPGRAPAAGSIATCCRRTTAASGCSARPRGRASSSPTCSRCPEAQRPPAIAGRITSTSPSPTGVSRPSSTRTSSSLR